MLNEDKNKNSNVLSQAAENWLNLVLAQIEYKRQANKHIKIKNKKMKNNTSTFSTDSFQLAIYLLSEACRLIRLDRTNPRRILFEFEETNERKLLTDKFLSYKSVVEPHRLFSAQKDLKQLIYQNQ